MELALLLVLLVIFELAFTVWFLARQRTYLSAVKDLSGRVDRLERHVVRLAESSTSAPVSVDVPASDGEVVGAAASILDEADPADVEKAEALLGLLGYRRD